jgi:hypothetical protein
MTSGTKCPWCLGRGYIERIRACPCKAPEKASEWERMERWANAVHDPGCEDGWVTIRERCDCIDSGD